MTMNQETLTVLLGIPAGIIGIAILAGILQSICRGSPANGLVRQAMLISFPGTSGKRYPYLGAVFLGILLTLVGVFAILGLVDLILE